MGQRIEFFVVLESHDGLDLDWLKDDLASWISAALDARERCGLPTLRLAASGIGVLGEIG